MVPQADRPRSHRARSRSDHAAKIWVGDQRRIIRENLRAAAGAVEMITLTPPGASMLPWDRERCTHGDELECSGDHGCVCQAEPLALWTSDWEMRWSRLHAAAAAHTRRKVGSFELLVRVHEPQRRGPYHVHIAVSNATARDRVAASIYRGYLDDLAAEYGFGFVSRRRRVFPTAAHAANYLAKYLSDAGGDKLGIADVIRRDDCPARPVWVNRRLQALTRSTMRAARHRRQDWKRASHLAPVRPADGISVPEASLIRIRKAMLRRARWAPPRAFREEDPEWARNRERYIFDALTDLGMSPEWEGRVTDAQWWSERHHRGE